MMQKLLYLAPHLSTGGMPQYLYKQIETLQKDFNIYCIEWSNITGGVLVIQRNRIQNLLGNKLITLGEDKTELFKHINKIQPDVIHLQEIPEIFTLPYDIAAKLYSTDRKYTLIETSHDSSFDVNNKLFFPDRFLMVSQYQVNEYRKLNIPCDLVEYPIEYKTRTKSREEALKALGLDPNKKHIINVGLFTPRKNQAEVIEYAKKLKDYPIQFHFLGNQADNFQWYWEPLMKDFPSNCKWWNERNDVDAFYEAADLFLFTSRGSNTDKETMPLVIREAISWKAKSLIYNLPVYLNYFDKYDNIQYLDFDNLDNNCNKILNRLNLKKETVDELFDLQFIREENKLLLNYKKQEASFFKISIKDKDSNAPIYWFDAEFKDYCNWWVIPTPLHSYSFANEPSFSTLLIEFYDKQNNLQFVKEIYVKEASIKRTVKLDLKNPFDCLFNNYNEMFVEKKYDCYELDNLDTVFDIGANNGLFSLLMVEKGSKKVFAFEPNQDSLINLHHMFRNDARVGVVEKAVYTKDEDLEFYIDPSNTTIGSVSKDHLLSNGTAIEKITVPAISLKTFIKEQGLTKVDLVKMDIEGAEYEIIENLEDDVYAIIDSFLIEFHDNNDQRVEKLLTKLKQKGYDITQIRNQNSRTNEHITFQYLTEPVGTFLAKKTPKEKLLTVIVPSYNHSEYIKQCLDSVLSQKTLFNFNILISDDCSSDNTYEIAQKYQHHPGVIVQQTAKNEGPTSSRIYNLVKTIKSKYITFLDADDYYMDDYKLQKQFSFLEQNPEYVIHSTGHYVSKEDSVAYGANPSTELFMHSLIEEVQLKDNLDQSYVSFGYMFNNTHIRGKNFPKWFFDKDVFDGYWALINYVLQYGKAKNEKWVSGRYRITPGGHFGEKAEEWKREQVNRQAAILKQAARGIIKPILIVDAFFHDKHCLEVFKKYLSFIKKLEIPIMLVTNSDFDQSLVKEVDYVLYDSNNRLFEKDYNDIESIVFYYCNSDHYFSLGTKGFQKHGLSVLSNLHHSTNLAKSLGFTHFYRIEYDCYIENMDKVKQVIDDVDQQNKKGLLYTHQDRHASFQLWYFELNYFTKLFPQINNEDDYVEAKQKFKYDRDFVSAEEFIYNMFKTSKDGFSQIIAKDAPYMHTDFGSCLWNTVMTPLESNRIVDGFMTSLHRLTKPSREGLSVEISERDDSKVALITWNCSSSNRNKSTIRVTLPSGEVKLYEHIIEGANDHRIELFDLGEQDLVAEFLINDRVTKSITVNKNNVYTLTDVYQKYN